MAIQLSQSDYWELIIENDSNWQLYDPADDLDWIGTYPAKLGQGHIRGIQLQAGLTLDIANYQLRDDLSLQSIDREHPIEFTFHLLGGARQEQFREIHAGMYGFFGSGMAPGSRGMNLANQPTQWVSVHMEPVLLHSFVGIRSEEIPPEFEHLIRRSDQESYSRYGTTPLAMQAVVQQIFAVSLLGDNQARFSRKQSAGVVGTVPRRGANHPRRQRSRPFAQTRRY
ncbi:MAG: hypothetical protein HC866_20005 [Leptolyngbyaceae cyanobacterium RU_5_1]|nr:hypothetical protein [Leptolyngbyaceae cyanobacterium RU_5_1]